MIPIPVVNSTCAYKFTSAFASLNGIYTLEEIISYNEAIATGVDFVVTLYTPAGLLATQFAIDAPSYVNDAILYLIPANPGGIPIYAPVSILNAVPDPMIGCYNNVAIGVSLGLFADQTQLAWIISELNSIVGSVVGVTTPVVKLYSLGTEYMRVTDYEALVALRVDARIAYKTLYQQLQEQIALTEAAQSLNTYYQATLVSLSTITGSGGP